MSELTKNEKEFVGYEYKDVTVKQDLEPVYADAYTNFGWTLEGTALPMESVSSVTLKFKRDRKISNKTELNRLQRQFDSYVSEIEKLEFSKGVNASVAAYLIGIVGSAFMAGSVFAVNGENVPLMVILAIPGFIGWIVPYFYYTRIRSRKTQQVSPLIDQKYDEIYEVCKKANALLA